MKCRKVINTNLSRKMPPKTKKQIETCRQNGIKSALSGRLIKHEFKKGIIPHNAGKNWDDKTKKKISEGIKLKIEEGDWHHFKGKHHTEQNKIKHSMVMSGREMNPDVKAKLIRRLVLNPPMHNPEVKKKHQEKMNLYGLNRRKKIDPAVFEHVVKEFKSGKSINELAKEIGINRWTLSKILKRNNITYDVNERLSLYSKTNPNIKKNQYKEVKNEENIVVFPFNPAVICN